MILWKTALELVAIAATLGALAAADGPPPTPEPPASVTTVGNITSSQEPGQRLVVSGQVFAPDGITPVAGVIVYAYQTSAEGLYANDPVSRVARLHGWAKTDAHGRFEFRTIRPGAYPGRSIPAHIHMHVWGAGFPLQWTDDLRFADDPLLKTEDRARSQAEGKFGGVSEVRVESGAQHCTFNIRLSRETNYPAAYRDDPRTK